MIDEIKRRLEAGESVELECINEGGFLGVDGGFYLDENSEILRSGLFVDKAFDGIIDILNCDYPITFDEIQYFKIKEDKKTFYNLVDVAVQAVKDDLITIDGISNWQIQYTAENKTRYIVSHDHSRIEEEIDYINSLYIETFVIESEKDMLRIKSNAEITLANGEKITSAGIINNLLSYFSSNEDGEATRNNYVGFTFIKGATVTQKKTNN